MIESGILVAFVGRLFEKLIEYTETTSASALLVCAEVGADVIRLVEFRVSLNCAFCAGVRGVALAASLELPQPETAPTSMTANNGKLYFMETSKKKNDNNATSYYWSSFITQILKFF